MSQDQTFIPDDPTGLPDVLAELQANFQTHVTKDVNFRKQQLRNLIRGHNEYKDKIAAAMYKDIGWNEWLTDLFSNSITNGELEHMLTNMDAWAKKQMLPTPLSLGLGTKCYTIAEPLGVALVLAAWNYAVYTALPFVGAAIAAGNCVVLKPSELAPHSSHVLKEIFQKYLDQRFYRCIQGKVEIARTLTTLKFDIILFTGSTRTGRFVAQAAAANLVPCVLELGGKCPVVIDESCDLQGTIRRVILAKFGNSGQTCVSADHLYVHKNIKPQFQEEFIKTLKQFYGQKLDNQADMGRIINKTHVQRLDGYLKQNHGGKILAGGAINHNTYFIQPTLVDCPREDSLLMTEEIFGPLLPICEYSNIEELIKTINSKPKPLAVYCFTQTPQVSNLLREKTSSGAFVVNDAMTYLINNDLPFGGVGMSGYGRYHGKSGFDACSNIKSVVEGKVFDPFPINSKFPPYTDSKIKKFKTLLKVASITDRTLLKFLLIIVAGIVLFFFLKNQIKGEL